MLIVAACSATPTLEGFDTADIEVGDETLTVAVALSSTQRNQGLRGVETIPEGIDGMLFVFGGARSATFGMLDTSIPLDIWWFDGEGRLVGSAQMEPCPSPPCASYASPGDVAWALETPAGELSLAPGDVLVAGISS